MQGGPPVSGLGDEVEELAAAGSARQPSAAQGCQRRVIGLEYRELGDVSPVDLTADGTLAQIGGERLDLGQFRHDIDSA